MSDTKIKTGQDLITAIEGNYDDITQQVKATTPHGTWTFDIVGVEHAGGLIMLRLSAGTKNE